MQSIAQTPLHEWHVKHGGRLIERDRWRVVASYTTLEQESAAARSAVGLADLSAFAKTSCFGHGTPSLISEVYPNKDVPNRGVFRIDANAPVTACRLADQHLLLLSSSPGMGDLGGRINALGEKHDVVVTDATSAYAGFGLVGPRVEDILRQLCSLDVSERAFPLNSCAETSVAGVHGILVRTSQATPAMRLYVGWDLGEYVWESIMRVGRRYQITAVGVDTWQRLMG